MKKYKLIITILIILISILIYLFKIDLISISIIIISNIIDNLEDLSKMLKDYLNINNDIDLINISEIEVIENNISNDNNISKDILDNNIPNIDSNNDILNSKPFYKSKEFLIISGLILIIGIGVFYLYNISPTEINNISNINNIVNNNTVNNVQNSSLVEDLENLKYYLDEMNRKFEDIDDKLEVICNREDILISDVGHIVEYPWWKKN